MTRWGPLVVLALAACRDTPPAVDQRAEAEGHYLAGNEAYLAGRFTEAHHHFDAVGSLAPADSRLPAALGELLYAEGKIAEAVSAFERATLADPKRATNWSRLAQLRAVTGDTAGAKQAASEALRLNDRDVNALEVLGDALRRDGALSGAVAAWQRAADLAVEPNRSALVLKATTALRSASRGEEALALLLHAVDAGVSGGDVLTELGARLVEARRFSEAVVAFTQAARADSTDPTLWELVGELEQQRGALAAAEQAYRASLAVKNRSVVHVALARLCLSKADAGCAARQLDDALASAAGDDPREALELAELLERVGRRSDALTLLDQASQEPEQRSNVALHRRVAQLAQALTKPALVAAACQRVRDADAGTCP